MSEGKTATKRNIDRKVFVEDIIYVIGSLNKSAISLVKVSIAIFLVGRIDLSMIISLRVFVIQSKPIRFIFDIVFGIVGLIIVIKVVI